MSWWPDAAVRLHAAGELRRRWASFVVLGVLIGGVGALALAGATGARRASDGFDHYQQLNPTPDAAVAPNDPAFDEPARRAVAALEEVHSASAFAVTPLLARVGGEVVPDLFAYLPPVPEDYGSKSAPERFALLRGRAYDPAKPDEAVVSADVADALGLDVGATFDYVVDPASAADVAAAWTPVPMRVVGVVHEAGGQGGNVYPSPAFVGAHGDDLVSFVNQWVWLQPGVTVDEFQRVAAAAAGLDRLAVLDLAREKDDARRATQMEAAGLWLFAVAALVGGGAVIGQALARAVSGTAADNTTLEALGMRGSARRLVAVAPAALAALIAAAIAVAGAVALSPLFPIGESRTFEMRLGVHVDGPVLVVGGVGLLVVVMGVALVASWWSTRPFLVTRRGPSVAGRILRSGVPVPVAVGAHLALDPGRGQRAIPVRSAMVGAVAGVLGVVGALTFRAGIDQTLANPERYGVHADAIVGAPYGRSFGDDDVRLVRDDDAVDDAVVATWWRSMPIGETGSSVWTYRPVRGEIPMTVLQGRLPDAADEIALAPLTRRANDVEIGERIGAGPGRARELLVVGEVLVPNESHSGYRSGGVMTVAGAAELAPARAEPGVDFQQGMLVTWHPGSDAEAALARLGTAGLEGWPLEPPVTATSLRNLLGLPYWLAAFLALLAVTTVAHALATTVRRRRHELAVMVALGLSARQARLSIAAQATLLAVVGLIIGVPIGVLVGRALWRVVNDMLSFLYVAPLAVAAVLAIWPFGLAIVNLVAAVPARRAGAIRPAAVLRTE